MHVLDRVELGEGARGHGPRLPPCFSPSFETVGHSGTPTDILLSDAVSKNCRTFFRENKGRAPELPTDVVLAQQLNGLRVLSWH